MTVVPPVLFANLTKSPALNTFRKFMPPAPATFTFAVEPAPIEIVPVAAAKAW